MALISSFILVAYILIALEKWHRTTIVFFFAALTVALGLLTPEEAWHAIDYNTIGLLIGMMIIVNIMKQTGIFKYLALKAVKASKGNIFLIFVMITGITGALSAFLDNVTMVILITPISIFIAETMGISPFPFFIGEIIASNMGGTATLIGDPPNVMIGSAAHLSFFDFFVHLTPLVLLAYGVFILYFKVFESKKLGIFGTFDIDRLNIMPEKALKNKKLLKKSLFVFTLVLLGFFFHPLLKLEPSVVALTGAALLLVLSKHNPEDVLKEVEWATLVFLAGFFILVGGLEKFGVITYLAKWIVSITSNIKILAIIILIISAFVSSILDNIPFVAAMIPIIATVNAKLGIHTNTLWWALSLGACLGGNGTLIGASANVVVASMSTKTETPLTFKNYLRYGPLATLISITLSALYIWFFL